VGGRVGGWVFGGGGWVGGCLYVCTGANVLLMCCQFVANVSVCVCTGANMV
jgi:hypothetical protein